MDPDEKAIQSPQHGQPDSDHEKAKEVAPDEDFVMPKEVSMDLGKDHIPEASIDSEEPSPENELLNKVAPVAVRVETAIEVLDIAEEADLVQPPVEPADAGAMEGEASEIQTVTLSEETPDQVDEPQHREMAEGLHESHSSKPPPQADGISEEVSTVATAQQDVRTAEEGRLVKDSALSEEPLPTT